MKVSNVIQGRDCRIMIVFYDDYSSELKDVVYDRHIV